MPYSIQFNAGGAILVVAGGVPTPIAFQINLPEHPDGKYFSDSEKAVLERIISCANSVGNANIGSKG